LASRVQQGKLGISGWVKVQVGESWMLISHEVGGVF
jgi:hypothetical protein